MQPTFYSSRILLPVRPWFIVFSVFVALLLNFLPTSAWPWMPDWVALVLIFWSIREPRRVGMGVAFLLGLIMDVADASLLGQHALAYVVLAYCANAAARRVLWFPLLQQALHMLPLFVLTQVLMVAVRLLAGAEFPGWSYFLSSLSNALLWAPLSILLMLPQYQPVDRDDNRPI